MKHWSPGKLKSRKVLHTLQRFPWVIKVKRQSLLIPFISSNFHPVLLRKYLKATS